MAKREEFIAELKTSSNLELLMKDNNASYIVWLEEKNKDLINVLKCVRALDLPYQEGRIILEKNGFDFSERYDKPAIKFVSELIDGALKEDS